jgi:diguanylate cyclase
MEQARRLATAALEKMAGVKVPPTPRNFAVWYAYCHGQPPEIVSAIDGLLKRTKSFDTSINDDLYLRFCVGEIDAGTTYAAGTELEALLHRVSGDIVSYGEDASRFGRAVAGARDELSRNYPAATGTLAQLIAETHRIDSANRGLKQRLDEASSEIDELKRSLQEARTQAETDALTGIANRKRFDSTLDRALEAAHRDNTPLSLLMVDIDRFKLFNDTYGHQLGDQVLKLVARAMQDSVRGHDVVARYGGEEFSVILPKAQLAQAVMVAERIRTSVSSRRIVRRNSGEALGGITLSAGASEYRRGENPATLIQRADEALYFAKRNGRNRVATESEVAAGPARAQA